MTIDEVTLLVLQKTLVFVDYCSREQDCEEARFSELEMITDLNDEWFGKVEQIRDEIGNKKFQLVFSCLLDLGRRILDGADFSTLDDYNKFYEFEILDNDFGEMNSWCTQIHNEINKHCAYINLSRPNSLMEDLYDDIFVYSWIITREPATVAMGGKYIFTDLYKGDVFLTKDELKAIIKFEMILCGKQLKPLISYTKNFLQDSIAHGFAVFENYSAQDKEYIQIESLCDVLSDYHASTGILDKYLRIYHVYEELMVRISLVKFTSHSELTARDLTNFKKQDEINALKDLLKFMVQDTNSSTQCNSVVLAEIKGIWNQLTQETKDYLDQWYVNNIADSNLAKDFMTLCNNAKNLLGVTSFIGFVIYQTRCRIVHNKATEFHLTYQKLDATNLDAIANFMIPLMEVLCIKTLSDLPDYLSYDKNKLTIRLY